MGFLYLCVLNADLNSPYEIFVRELVAKDGNDQNEILLLDAQGLYILLKGQQPKTIVSDVFTLAQMFTWKYNFFGFDWRFTTIGIERNSTNIMNECV